MKVTMVCEHSLPASTGGGPRLNQWAITDELRQRGYQVQVVYIAPMNHFDQIGMYCLQSRGVLISPVAYESANPYGVARTIAEFQPDVIGALSSWNIAWASAYNREIPRVCIVGDPEHIIFGYRRQLKNREPMTYEEIASAHNLAMKTKETYLPILRDCAHVFCTAAHSAEWFNQQGLPVEYLPMPVVEPAFPGWRRRPEDMPKNDKMRILMTGHLGGIATLSGLYYLLDEVLPNMPDYADYDWNICGGDELLPSLAQRFKQYPEIKFRGFVEDIRKEMLQADIFLCTTSSTCGVRTRLVEAFAMGSCVVAHSANGIGQPEFEHESNIGLDSDGKGLAQMIRVLARHPEKRYEMGLAARQTFEERFRTELSAGRVIDVMQEVVQHGK